MSGQISAELNLLSKINNTMIDAIHPMVGMKDTIDAANTQMRISLNSRSTLVTLAANQRNMPPITTSIKKLKMLKFTSLYYAPFDKRLFFINNAHRVSVCIDSLKTPICHAI